MSSSLFPKRSKRKLGARSLQCFAIAGRTKVGFGKEMYQGVDDDNADDDDDAHPEKNEK